MQCRIWRFYIFLKLVLFQKVVWPIMCDWIKSVSKKIWTNHSIDTVLYFVQVLLKQTLCNVFIHVHMWCRHVNYIYHECNASQEKLGKLICIWKKNEEIKVIQIVYRLAQMSCPLLHGNKKKKTDTENWLQEVSWQ